MFCCTLLYVHSSIAIILMGKRELIVLLNLSSWCLVMVERLFLAMPRGCLRFVIVVFPDHTHLLFLIKTVIVKFRIFCFGNVLLYNRQKRDTGNKIDTNQRYTETKISRKTFMLDNIRMVGNGHNTNYVAQL